MLERGTHPPPLFWKCVKRKGFKSFVLKVCETKGVADAFLRKCVKLKELERKVDAHGYFRGVPKRLAGILASFYSSLTATAFSGARTT